MDETTRTIVKQVGLEKEFEKLWVIAGGDKNKIPFIWDPRKVMLISEELGDNEPSSEWELPAPKLSFLNCVTGVY